MESLRTYATSELIDMLSQYTANYTKMLSQGILGEEYLRCKEAIKAIQSEIELRQKEGTVSPTPDNSTMSA